jgi:hypothetical protein
MADPPNTTKFPPDQSAELMPREGGIAPRSALIRHVLASMFAQSLAPAQPKRPEKGMVHGIRPDELVRLTPKLKPYLRRPDPISPGGYFHGMVAKARGRRAAPRAHRMGLAPGRRAGTPRAGEGVRISVRDTRHGEAAVIALPHRGS